MDLSSVVLLDIIVTIIIKVLGIACAFKYLVR